MKTYHEKKICFILCYQEEKEIEECLLYLNMLEVPEEYETELLTVQKEESIVAGYQEAMDYSDAHYKVYLDTGTYIINRQFIYDLLQVFQSDDQIAMLGVMGCEKLSRDGVLWHSELRGNIYRRDKIDDILDISIERQRMLEAEAIEHYLMVTAEDIPWRSDLFCSAEFAGVAKALEFRKAGYKVVVPPQDRPWVIYEEPVRLLTDYETERQSLLKVYSEIFADRKDLRILMLRTSAMFMTGIAAGFIELGHQVILFKEKISAYMSVSRNEQEAVEVLLEEGHYDLVVTIDYAISASEACRNVGVKYFAWVFDSPQPSTYHKSALNEYCHISVFDRYQYERMQKKELPHLYYSPLAADVELFGCAVVDKDDEKKYTADISFVGKLYSEDLVDKVLDNAPENIKEDFQRAVEAPGCIWDGTSRLEGKLSCETLQYLLDQRFRKSWAEYQEEQEYFLEAAILGNKVNMLERITILNKLAEQYRVRLYTPKGQKAEEMLRNVQICPPINYNIEAPKVFYLSRINLNITSRSIVSGLPQRIWDVLACGGFMLTNYQPEIEEYFRIGEDLEVYHDLDELVDKVGYYLNHEDERLKIALSGYQTVRTCHGYVHRLKPLLSEILGEDY